MEKKTTLIRDTLTKDYQVISLLKAEDRVHLLENPSHLRRMIDPKKQGVVIDEIQKIPDLLDEVHHLIEEQKIKLLLTGSSARKLKRHSANLLGGRARVLELFGMTHAESKSIPIETKLRWGSLPAVLLSEDPWEDLKAYTDTYLKEEIEEEAAVASDAGVAETTVRSYFEILRDTLIGYALEPWRESKKERQFRPQNFIFLILEFNEPCLIGKALKGTLQNSALRSKIGFSMS